MDLPAFKFVDGALVELPKQEFRPTFVEFIPREVEPKIVERKLSPRMRRLYARKGRPRRRAKRIDAWTTEWKWPVFSYGDEIVWHRHTIAIDEEIADPYRLWHTTVQTRPICFVYMPKGKDVDDAVLDAVMRWHRERRMR